MCFSATASFASAAIVGTAGIASLGVTKWIENKPFACVPLVFAAQQSVE